jgi:hypothetical protein
MYFSHGTFRPLNRFSGTGALRAATRAGAVDHQYELLPKENPPISEDTLLYAKPGRQQYVRLFPIVAFILVGGAVLSGLLAHSFVLSVVVMSLTSTWVGLGLVLVDLRVVRAALLKFFTRALSGDT